MQSNNVAVRLYNGKEVMFLMTVAYSKIKTVEILDKKGPYCTGLCSFRMNFLYSLKTDQKARGNGLQVAQHLLVPDLLR
jgi:hypothetical protein